MDKNLLAHALCRGGTGSVHKRIGEWEEDNEEEEDEEEDEEDEDEEEDEEDEDEEDEEEDGSSQKPAMTQ